MATTKTDAKTLAKEIVTKLTAMKESIASISALIDATQSELQKSRDALTAKAEFVSPTEIGTESQEYKWNEPGNIKVKYVPIGVAIKAYEEAIAYGKELETEIQS